MIEWKIGNPKIPEGKLGREFGKELERGIERSLTERARRTYCPRHGRSGRVLRRGGKLVFEGCCEEHVAKFSKS